ncbi:Ank2 [Symbiodinium microadriaticum]|nr:Ank2 [Symbiodinium microadriaticum]
MGQRACTCCLKREAEFQELPRVLSDPRARHASQAQARHVLGPAGPQGLATGSCLLCREVAANTMCLPCGHLLICYRCSLRYALPDGSLHPDVRCPNCKVSVKSFQRVLLQTASTMTRLSEMERTRALSTNGEAASSRLSFASKQMDQLVTKSELGTLQRDGSFKDSLGQKLFTADANGDGALTRAEFQTGLATVASTSSSDIGTLFQEVRSKYWLTTKRQYCCNMQGICSFDGPPVTPTTETTTEGPSYDCHEDYDNRLSWPEHKRAWCCARYHVACFQAPTELYHCDHGFGSWQTTWSPHKKAWCCFHLGKGCDFHYGHSHTHYYVVHHAAYDCQAGLSNWKAGWSENKKSWCCQHEGTGCVAQFDCHAGLANWEAGWSPHKKLWCCSHFGLGCADSAPKPFDCLAGLSNWQAGWSSEKKSWCCAHEDKGCESGPITITRQRAPGRAAEPQWPGVAARMRPKDGTGTVASDALFSSFSESCESAKCREMQVVGQSCNRWMQHNGIGDFIETASCAVFFEHRRCPRHCGALFTGKEAARHLAHECPNREEICPYGCGDRLFGHEIDDGGEHPPECPMNLALVRVEAALEASAVKEYRLALENVYVERDRARARFKARGERDPGPVFTTPHCQQRVRRVEAEGLNLLTRARRASKEKLQWVIALAALGPGDGTASSQVPPGAARYWDTMDVSKEYTRSSRPWDMGAPILDPLLQTLQDARICGADSKLRRKAEALLFMAVRRCLEAALVTEVSRGDAVRESLLIADEAMEVCELEDCGDLRDLCALAEKEVLRTTLRSLQTTCKEFHQAVKDGDIELAKWLLDREKANPSITDPDTGIPPLVMAVKAGDIAMCELLLDRGADVDARCSSDGTSSLHWACHSRTFRVVKLLLERRANPRLQDKRGHDPLVKLVRRDFSSPADACVLSWQQQDSHRLAGPELKGCGGFMTIEAAKVAAESCDCVGFSVHELVPGAEWSEECFHITMHGPGCASAIPSNVATTEDEASDLVWSHLDVAWTSFLKVKNDPAHDVSALLAVGADPCSEDLKGLTALHHHLLTAPGGGCAACVSALLRGGADVNHRDIGRQVTPFILAIQTKRTDLVRLMLKSAWPTPDVDCKAPDGTCALALATALGAREIADMLRKAGASDWADAELRLGSRTIFTFDTRNPPVNNYRLKSRGDQRSGRPGWLPLPPGVGSRPTMVLESRLADLLQGQAKKFIHGFNAEHLNLGLLSGFLELRNLALNPEPVDDLLLGSDLPFVLKAGTLSSAMLQLSIMQGELEIIIDGLDLVLAPACRWLSREEVYQHRTNEMERLEFVHMRSQTQRRSLEREMFRKLFVDYLSRIRVTVKNVHVRLEIEGELHDNPEGPPLALGVLIAACDVKPVVTESQSGEDARKSELLLAESVHLRGLQLYQEFAGTSKVHVPWDVYHSTRSSEFGIFQKLSQVEFVRGLNQTRDAHLAFPACQQLMPSTDMSIKVDLKSQALFTDCHVENCLTLEVALCLQNLSRLRFTASIVEGIRWLVRRTLDFQMWPFLHALHGKPATGRGRWHVIRSFVALKRRIQSNAYALQDAVRMRINCKEYIRLYKKKFNGPQSSFAWRRSLPALTAEDATTLGLIELSYPADKLVNFRLMAQTEMKTETSINCYAEEGTMPARSPRSNLSWQVRELTPMEQLHLHGQHGFGTNIFRGLPPPPSNLKVRIDIVAPDGLWWVCSLSTAATSRQPDSWAVAVDSRQPIRLLLVDSITDNSVFATMEVPRAKQNDRPLALLLGRTEEAFASSSPGRRADGPDAGQGGTGPAEWCSVLEFDGSLCCWGQVKTVPMCASHSPWDIFASFNCGTVIDHELRQNDTSFGRVSPIEEVLSAGFSKGSNATKSPTIGEEAAYVRLNLPLRLASGQEGPLVEFLRWCMAPAPKMRWPHAGSQQSALAYLAVLARACACSSLYYIILYYIILYYIILYYIILYYIIVLYSVINVMLCYITLYDMI